STVDGSDDVLITTTKNKYFYDGDSNATVKVDFTKYNGTSNGVIRVDITDVTKATAVHISGSNNAVKGIKIQTSKTYQNGVILDNVTLTSGNFPCVEMTKKGSVNVQLIGTNILNDGRTFGIGYGEEYSTTSGATYEDDDGNTVSCTIVRSAEPNGSDAKGTLYARGDVTIYGSGTLNVTQHYKNCIASKMILTIENGSYSLTSTGKAGLYGDYAVNMKGGNVTFNGTGSVSTSELRKANGIKTDDDTYMDSFVSVDGGTLNVTTAYGKGISSPVVNLAGGTNTITVNSPTTKQLNISSSYVSADGVSKSATESFAPQGISGDTVNLTGGSWTINAPWSGIDCDGNMSVSGGTVNITTTANGLLDSSENDYDAPSCVKVSGNMNVTNGTITGSNSGNCGKGIKVGGTYTQTGCNITLNVTGSNLGSSSSSNMGGGPSRPGQQSSSSSSASSSAKGIKVTGAMNISGGKLYVTANSHEAIETKSTLTISGGEVYAASSDDAINSAGVMTIKGGYVFANSSGNDGIDSNGNMTISGGTIVAVGANGAEVGIDVIENGTLTINGGNIIAVGGLENTNNVSGSAYQASSYNKGTWYGFYNASGSSIIAFKVPSNSSMGTPMAVYSSTGKPSLVSGVTGSGTGYWNGYGYSECRTACSL
ncbi:MAG: carbohydrate-binding domain-containing protein, partial [Spirochaetales bacterium]|nr:carbohydrate-binding domain-containing protein [Spirochaetales bacterium]